MGIENAPQLSLEPPDEPPERRVRALAGVLAGFRFPSVGFDRLTKPQQNLIYETAREALRRLQEAE